MQIHSSFKNSLANLRSDIKTKHGLTGIDMLPNEDIIQKIQNILTDEELNNPDISYEDQLRSWQIQSEEGDMISVSQLFDPGNVKAICDNYIWLKSPVQIFSWRGIVEGINHRAVQTCDEEELFTAGKIVRVCAIQKMRNTGLLRRWEDNNLKTYIGKHFKVLGYNKEGFSIEDDKLEAATLVYRGNVPHKKVYVEDAYGNIYIFPQSLFVPTTVKNLQDHQKEETINRIIDNLENSARYDIGRLTEAYQASLRIFMEASKRLEEKLSGDFRTEAERIYDIQMNMKDILERDTQIESVEYNPGMSLAVNTKPLWNSDLPIGRYRINIDLTQWRLNIINTDIQCTNSYQHPHINRNGEPCLGEWINPLRESYSKEDYITMVGGIISYLEDLNPHSVYQGMEEFQSQWKHKFKYQVDARKAENKPKEEQLIEAPEPTETDVIYNDDHPPAVYAVGQTVTIVDDDQHGHPIGTTGIVVEIIRFDGPGFGWTYKIEHNGNTSLHNEIYLSPVTQETDEQQETQTEG